MKILQAPENKWQELSNNLIVVCQYTTKQGEQVFGIDMMYKTQYPDFVEVEVLDPNAIWHEEDKTVQIVQNKLGVVWGIMNQKDIAYALVNHRETNNIPTYEEGDKYYFYANSVLPEHQAIFDAYPQLEIKVNHAEN